MKIAIRFLGTAAREDCGACRSEEIFGALVIVIFPGSTRLAVPRVYHSFAQPSLSTTAPEFGSQRSKSAEICGKPALRCEPDANFRDRPPLAPSPWTLGF